MKENVFLLKDGNLIITDKWKEIHDKIYGVLMRVDQQLLIYGLFELTDYLFLMDKAKVKIESVITQRITTDMRFDKNHKGFCKINEEFDNPFSLLEYLHSFNRIQYVNNIMARSIAPVDYAHMYEQVEFCWVKIELFKDGKSIYKYRDSYDKEGGFFNTKAVLTDIEKIYKSIIDPDNVLVINQELNQWRFNSNPIRNCLNGIPMLGSTSYSFYTDGDLYTLVNNLESTFCNTMVYDSPDIGLYYGDGATVPFTETERMMDFTTDDFLDSLEFICYLPYTTMFIETIKGVCETGHFNHDFRMVCYLEIYIADSDGEIIEAESSNFDFLSVSKLIKMFRKREKEWIKEKN